MPESADATTVRISDQLNIKALKGFLFTKDIKKIVEDNGAGFVGRGGDIAAVAPKDYSKADSGKQKPVRTDILHAVDHDIFDIKDNIRAKELFYVNRFLNILFPHNFPKIFTSSGRKEKKRSGTIRQWIHKQDVSQENIKYPFDRVTDAMNEMELPFKLEAGSRESIIAGNDGGEYFIERVSLAENPQWDLEKIEGFLEKNQYSLYEKRVVLKTIARLQSLKNKPNTQEVL